MVLINERKNQDIKGRRIKMYITGQYYIQVKIFKIFKPYPYPNPNPNPKTR